MTSISLEPAHWGSVRYVADEDDSSIRATERYIAGGADLDERHGPDSDTPLMRAAKDGRDYSVELLIHAGARVDKRDASGRLALRCAAMAHHGRCVELIAARSSDLHLAEAMVTACRWSDAHALLSLTLHARSVDTPSPCGETPLTMAVMYDVHCVDLLIRRGADVNATNTSGWTPLATAAMGGHAQSAARLLLQSNIDVNAVVDLRHDPRVYELASKRRGIRYIPSAMTPLLIAAAAKAWGSAEVFDMLLAHTEVDTRMTTTGDARGRLVEDLACPAMESSIHDARRTQSYRSRRGKMAAHRIQRFLRDTTCNPMYAAARRSLERLRAS